jgi:alpha-galactosidase
MSILLTPVVPGAKGYSKVFVLDTPTHDIRYVSDLVVYVEGLVDGRWVGRYWSAGGRINVPYEFMDDNAFELSIGGQPLATGWRWVGAHEEPRTERGAQHFVVELRSTVCPIDLKIHTLLDGTPILERWLEIKNNSKAPISLTAVYPWSGRLWDAQDYRASMPNVTDPVYRLGYFTETSHGWEGWFKWFPLKDASTHIRYDVGTGANDPFFIAHNSAAGEYFVGDLAWSANWEMDFKSDQEWPTGPFSGGMQGLGRDASLWFKIGPWASSPLRTIAAGESVPTFAVHLGPVQGDLDTAVQAMQEHVRRSVMPLRKLERSYLVQYAVPGDQGYIAKFMGDQTGMNEANMMKEVDLAAAAGAELFIVDAGWWDVYGEWTPSPTRFPRGLEPIADYIHKKGMLFGLYGEVEGARGDWTKCSWCRQHPDWFMPNFPNILNLTKPEVAAHVERQLSRMIEQYKLDLYREDYNTPFTGELGQTMRDGLTENDFWRYYEVWYGMIDRIHKKYPNLILQQCAAGGMRNDLGMDARWHEPYLTDGLNMPHVLKNYSGQTMHLPPENFVNAFGIPAISANRGHLDTHLRVNFSLGTPFLVPIAPSVEESNPDILREYARYSKLYKSFIRPLWPTCKMFHHAPITAEGDVDSSPWFAVEFAAPDRSKGWATIVRMREGDSDSYVFRPRGLDPARSYRVTFDSTQTTATIAGLRLIQDGLRIRLESTLSSELLLFEAE